MSQIGVCATSPHQLLAPHARMRPTLTRRALAALCAATPLQAPALDLITVPPLTPRLDAGTLMPLTALGVPSQPGELRYPQWLLGTWRLQNTISSFSMPLGKAFVDGFQRLTAEQDVAAVERLTYALRFVEAEPPTSAPALTCKQDRRFNAAQETSSFLGDDGILRSCEYLCDSRSPHGRLAIIVEDAPDGAATNGGPPGTTTIELGIEWAQWDASASRGAFVTSELVRQRVTRAADAGGPALDEQSLLEIITRYEQPRRSDGVVRARNRLVQYLSFAGDEVQIRGSGDSQGRSTRSKQAALTELAAGRAISFFDYDWKMVPVPDGTAAPTPPSEGTGSAALSDGSRRVLL